MTTTEITINGQAYEIANYTGRVPTSLPAIDWDDWRGEGCTEMADNTVDACYRYDLGDGLSLYIDQAQGDIIAIAISEVTLLEHICDWWGNITDDTYEQAEWLASWGYDGLAVLTKAKLDDEGPFRIWIEPQYYPGTYNAPQAGFAHRWATDSQVVSVDDDLGIAEFATYAEAQAYVDAYYSEPSRYDGIPQCNVLSHGQAGPDRLTIVLMGD
jgi:hypothetical protein